MTKKVKAINENVTPLSYIALKVIAEDNVAAIVTEGDRSSQKRDTITPHSFDPIYIKKGDGYRDENVTAHNVDPPIDIGEKPQKRDEVTSDISKNGHEILSTDKEIAESPIPSSPSHIYLHETPLPEGFDPYKFANPIEKRDETVTGNKWENGNEILSTY